MNWILVNIAILNWLIGMLLILLSNASFIIKQNEIERTGWKKYRMGYSIVEIKTYITKCEDQRIVDKLNRKIIYRRLYPLFLISTPILIYIANL